MTIEEKASEKQTRRVRKFKVERRFDGANGIRIEIVLGGREPILRVGLKHRRAMVEVLLGDVAEWVLVREAKARAAEKAKARAAKRSRR